MKKILTLGSTGLLLSPLLALAQFNGGTELTTFGGRIINFINGTLVPFIFAVALLLFIYGVYLYFFYGKSEDEARKKGRDYIMWAVIAMVVMVSVWGIVNLIANGLNLNDTTIDPLIPDGLEGNTRGNAP